MPNIADELAELRSRKVTKSHATKLQDAGPLSTPEQEEAAIRATAKEDRERKKEAETILRQGGKGVTTDLETDFKVKQGAKKKEDILKKKEAEKNLRQFNEARVATAPAREAPVKSKTYEYVKKAPMGKVDTAVEKPVKENSPEPEDQSDTAIITEAPQKNSAPVKGKEDVKKAAPEDVKKAEVVDNAVEEIEKDSNMNVDDNDNDNDNDNDDDDDVPQLEEQPAEAAVVAQEEDVTPGHIQNRSEKKSRKMMQRLGMKPVPGVARVTIKTGGRGLFAIDRPDVYQSPGKTPTYVIFGEARQSGPGGIEAQQQAAAVKAATAAASLGQAGTAEALPEAVPELSSTDKAEDVVEESEAGVDPKDVELVMSQASCSRAKAVAALKENDGDLVNAIMSLTT